MATVQLLLLLTVGCVTMAARPPQQTPPPQQALPPQQAPPCQVVQADVFCRDLSLRRAPLNLPASVRTLDLSRNRVQNLSRETLAFRSAVRHLDLRANEIRFIQPGLFGDMTRLRVLDLSRNRLHVFALSGLTVGPLPWVESLDLSHNGLQAGMSDSFLADSPSLANLSMAGNSITRIPGGAFRGALALRSISLHDNVILEIEDGAFDSLDRLTHLDLSKNSISCITDFNLYNLELLNLSQNSVELFHSARSGSYRLLSLDLSQNKMLHFPLLPEDNVLEFLDVSRNRLQSVNASGGSDRRPTLDRLRRLDLSFNRLTVIPQCFFFCMARLRVLNVSHNCLGSFSVTERDVLGRAAVLDLSFNALQTLTFGGDALEAPRALEKLCLQGNRLAALDPGLFQRLPALKYLQLEQNGLEVCSAGRYRAAAPSGGRTQRHSSGCVSFSSVRNLQFLFLSENRLRTLPAHAFAGTPLKVLDLSLNPGLDLHVDALSGLERSLVHLLLRENNISRMSADLSSLRSLRHVDLSTNRLTALPAWSRESSVESLNLQNNNLVTLESGTMTALEPSLKTLYVGSNPLSCCSNLDFLRRLRRSAVVVPDIEAVTCVRDGHSEPVGLQKVTEEMCRGPRFPKYAVVVLVILLVLMLTFGLLVKCCHAHRNNGSRSFSA